MSREKTRKNDLQSDNREIPDEVSVSIQEPRVMRFDVYFRKMMIRDSKVQAHHKVPMEKFAEQRGLKEATEEQFDKVFRSY